MGAVCCADSADMRRREREERRGTPPAASTSTAPRIQPTAAAHMRSISDLEESEPKCALCTGYGISNNQIVKCYFADKQQRCRVAWHRNCEPKLKHDPKFVCCSAHDGDMGRVLAASSGPKKYTVIVLDAGVKPIPPPPPRD